MSLYARTVRIGRVGTGPKVNDAIRHPRRTPSVHPPLDASRTQHPAASQKNSAGVPTPLSSADLWRAAASVSAKATLTWFASSLSIAAAVVPPGEVTFGGALRSSPVSTNMVAAPNAV